MNSSALPRAVALTALLWPACIVGAFLGGLIGMILRSVAGTSGGGWEAIGGALVGIMVGVPIAAGLLGWIWAIVCKRQRLLPTVVLLVVAGVAGISALVLISRIPGSGSDALRIAGTIAILLAATTATFLIGRLTPARKAARA